MQELLMSNILMYDKILDLEYRNEMLLLENIDLKKNKLHNLEIYKKLSAVDMYNKLDEEVKEVAQTLSAYADFEKENLIKKIQSQSIIGVIALMIYCILDFGGMPEKHTLLRYLSSYSLTLVFVTPITILFYTTGVIEKARKNRKISKFALIFVSCAIAIGVVFIIKAIVASFGL